MHISRKKVIVGVVSLLSWTVFTLAPPVARAEEGRAVLTLSRALDIASVNNQQLRLAENEKRSADVTLRQKEDNFLPAVSADSHAGFTHDVGATGSNRDYHALSAEVSADVNLFNGFADMAALEKAREAQVASRKGYDRQKQTLVFETIDAYLGAVRYLEQIRVAQQNLEENQRQLEDIEAYYRAGRRPETDVYKQQAETAKARSDLVSAQRDYEVGKLTLMQVLGVEAGPGFDVVLPEYSALTTTPSTDIDDLVRAAKQRRPDVLAKQNEQRAADAGIKVARAGYLPALDLVAGIGTGYDSRDDGDFGSQMNADNLYGSVGLNLSIPLFDRHVARNDVSQARLSRHSVGLELERLHRQVEVEVGQAVQEYLTATDQIDVAQATLTYAQDALESTEQRYLVGAATLTELTDARATLVEARYDLVGARIDKMLRTAAIDYYAGNLRKEMYVVEGDL